MSITRTVKVKICGITRLEDALKAAEAGADAVGFVFHRESPRYIRPEEAGVIARALPPFITTVGVFVNSPSDAVNHAMRAAGLGVAQLHGDEEPEFCGLFPRVIKAIRVRDAADIDTTGRYVCVSAFLLDAYSELARGGTGERLDWDIAARAAERNRIILAGGLTPENVSEAVSRVKPYAVDVSSGVEASKGIKDHRLIEEFIRRAKSVALQPRTAPQ